MRTEATRILLAADGLRIGGTERQIVGLLAGLRRGGRFRVYLAVVDPGGQLQDEAVRSCEALLPLARKARFDFSPAFSLLRYARRERVRLIHAFGWMSGLAGLMVARSLRIPIVNGSIRGTPPALRRRERISRWCAVRSDAIVANSDAGLCAYGLLDHPRARVIPNGLDLTRFDGVVPENLPDLTICMVANFNQYKDQATVIRAMPTIVQAVPEAQVLFVGNDAGSMAENRRLAAELGIERFVRFVSGVTEPEPFVAGARVCVLMSPEGEGFSNSILEYMALGKPVVATDCGGNAALVRDGETGFLVPDGSASELAARVVELLRNADRARAMGESGRRQVRSEYSRAKMVKAYESLYDSLLGGVDA